MLYKKYVIFCIIFIPFSVQSIVPERVILASDLNQNYIQFWPAVARWWREIVGIQKITFAVITNTPLAYEIDGNTDILYISSIPGVSTALHAQTIRLLLPTLYPDEVSIVADVDMLPLSSSFFLKSGALVPDDHLLIYHVYPESLGAEYYHRYPMCYIAGTGKTFSEIFKVSALDEFADVIKQWSGRNLGWPTDEKVLYTAVNAWDKFTTRVSILHDPTFYEHRLSKLQSLNADVEKLCAGFYYDGHCPRPYFLHKEKIEALVAHVIASITNGYHYTKRNCIQIADEHGRE